jgi:hypothetical protein
VVVVVVAAAMLMLLGRRRNGQEERRRECECAHRASPGCGFSFAEEPRAGWQAGEWIRDAQSGAERGLPLRRPTATTPPEPEAIMMRIHNLFALLFIGITLSGCEAIAGIFRAGFWVGAVGVIILLALVGWLVSRGRR